MEENNNHSPAAVLPPQDVIEKVVEVFINRHDFSHIIRDCSGYVDLCPLKKR
jgi:hypothetical protein